MRMAYLLKLPTRENLKLLWEGLGKEMRLVLRLVMCKVLNR